MEQRILLRSVEAVNLVHEEDGAAARLQKPTLGRLSLAPQVLDRARDGRDLDKLRMRGVGDDARQRRLSGAGGAVQNDGRERVALDGPPQPRTLAHRLLLAHKAVKRLGPHAHCKRGVGLALVALYV